MSNTDLQPPSTTAKLHDLLQVLDITSTKLTTGTLMLTNQVLLYNIEMEKRVGVFNLKFDRLLMEMMVKVYEKVMVSHQLNSAEHIRIGN